MTYFQMPWKTTNPFRPADSLVVYEDGAARSIKHGDVLFVLGGTSSNRLLARLVVEGMTHNRAFKHFALDVSGPRSAFFYERPSAAPKLENKASSRNTAHRVVSIVSSEEVQPLLQLCTERADFTVTHLPAAWPGIVRELKMQLRRVANDGQQAVSVSPIEQAATILRNLFVTSQLPGPPPVYLNAARLALGDLSATPSKGSTAATRHAKLLASSLNPLTDAAIAAGVNDDLASVVTTTPTSTRHQAILRDLRDRLQVMGHRPMYNGYFDCIVETAECDIIFEVKSATTKTFNDQMRLGIGQVLQYVWQRKALVGRQVFGHLVIDDVDDVVDPHQFLASLHLSFTWAGEIPNLVVQPVSRSV